MGNIWRFEPKLPSLKGKNLYVPNAEYCGDNSCQVSCRTGFLHYVDNTVEKDSNISFQISCFRQAYEPFKNIWIFDNGKIPLKCSKLSKSVNFHRDIREYLVYEKDKVTLDDGFKIVSKSNISAATSYLTKELKKIWFHNDFTLPDSEKQRTFRAIKLKNDLHAIIISDPTTEKAAFSISVNIGSFQNPENIPGLAHFLEHMVFLGTEKFPDPGEYGEFISQASGYRNAYTGDVETNYYFEIDADQLNEGVVRMSEFFKTPLFNADYIDKELLNIDSEHQKNLKKDINKLYTIFRTYAQSPYNKFSTGNLQTLKIWPEAKNISVRAEMIQFYNTFYSSNLMTAAIIGKEDIDSLTKVAIDNLSGIQNKHVTRPNFSGQNYLREPKASDQQQGKIILIEPVKDIRILRIIMKMPFLSDQEHLYNPLPKIIHHLIGNEGEGTLLALLKKENLAINLMAGSDITSNGGPIFSQVSMTLTENGLKNYETIILYYFQFIKLMKNNLPFQESLWTEQKKIKKMDFTFSSKFTDVGSLVKTISKTLHKSYFRSNPGKIYANYLDGYNKYDDKVKHLIEKILNEFKLENMFCFLSAKEFSKNWPEDVEKKTETLYNTTYGEGKFSDHLISKIIGVENNSNNLTIHEDLFLPSENQFIPDDFKVYYDSDSDFTDLGIVNYGMNNETENANVTDVVLPRARNPNWPILYKRNQNAIMFLKPFINNPPPKLQDIKPQPKMHATIKLVTFKVPVANYALMRKFFGTHSHIYQNFALKTMVSSVF